MNGNIYQHILEYKKNNKKLFAVLVDPDKYHSDIIEKINEAKVDILLVGGSLLSNGSFEKCIADIRKRSKIPVVIFPGNDLQISNKAQGILLLSLISGRNADLLIGKHVIAAPLLRASKLEIIPTGYILIDSGKQTSALYMSNTNPIPFDKPDIAACTAMAGEMLGLKIMYMDAGSGAENCVSAKMIQEVKNNIKIPLIVGGGINSSSKAKIACEAGADMIVVGNAAEKDNKLIKEIAKVVHSYKK
ncbi:MAG: geranylgeranylglyceryl/heptaprenylglyceryl phosphate synthase [Bacteroidetes bacterium]|nr:geranylgeranylglyceryl/heptaprenylglyceryl phosphate synthase [Bacteroidota bacterium]